MSKEQQRHGGGGGSSGTHISESVLSFLMLLLMVWLISAQVYVGKNSKDTEHTINLLKKEILSAESEIELVHIKVNESYMEFAADASRDLQELEETRAGVQSAIEEAVAKEEALQKEQKKKNLQTTQDDEDQADVNTKYHLTNAKGPILSNKYKKKEQREHRVGALKYLESNNAGTAAGDNPGGVDTDGAVEDSLAAEEVKNYLLQIYPTLYQYSCFQGRILQWRAHLSWYIHAIEQRYDRMLYNYI